MNFCSQRVTGDTLEFGGTTPADPMLGSFIDVADEVAV